MKYKCEECGWLGDEPFITPEKVGMECPNCHGVIHEVELCSLCEDNYIPYNKFHSPRKSLCEECARAIRYYFTELCDRFNFEVGYNSIEYFKQYFNDVELEYLEDFYG